MGYDLRTALHQYTHDPDPAALAVDPAPVGARVRRGRMVRTATTGTISAAAAVVLVAAAYGLTTLPTTDRTPVAPASPSDSAVQPSATPTPSATTPTSEPGPTTTPLPGDPGAAQVPVFRSGARVSDFPANAPEAAVVAYLTERLGVEPETEAEAACPTSGLPGRILGWPGTGVGVRVRTTDDAGGTVDPYIATWTLMEPSATLGLATEAGLTAGAPRERVLEVYPDATYGEDELSSGGDWWFEATDAGGSILVIGAGENPIYRIESGHGCGE
ncbi:hypothetical protein [Cellulomonas sp. S1-8]|uniref:hypothetical protein n=1 Tax=Cellulomonas sp. S1-8 TaxID=2904790 RepID=UPI0022431990|nr:hypothetical protein [Cellulomonas sp. S1-8]UZN03315.1 hypothetical protein OKX07_20075 [Cellulomonas sp. S1-8]